MEQREIEIFLALADELHFGRTAERLHVTTARVSQSIKKIERMVGQPLFERTSRQVSLTPTGRRLYDELRPAYEQIQAAINTAVAAGKGIRGTVRVGFIGAAAASCALAMAEVFRERNPDCDVEIRENQFADGAANLLRAEEIDLLLATLPIDEPDLTTSPVIFREVRLLAVSARHPFARRDSVSLADVTRDKVLQTPAAVPDSWDRALVPAERADGTPTERGPAFATIQEMLTLIGAGIGVYVLPEQATSYYSRPDVVYVPIHDAPPFEWVLAWRPAAESNRIRAFIQAAIDYADSLPAT